MSGLFGGGGGGVDIPTKKAENVSRTAKPLEQVSEAGRKRRRKRQAFAATRGFADPQLARQGLTAVLGVPGQTGA